jgi:phosphodiesterase/alkaline phosphatase D-like protein
MKSLFSALVMLFCCAALVAQSGSYSSNSYPGQSSTTQMISNGPVAETVSDSSAFLGWSTKEPSTSTESVRYGTKRDKLTETAEVADTHDGKNHHARLQNLSSDTVYYFQVIDNGQVQGGIGTFRTVAEGEKPVQSKAVISQK